MSGLVEFTFKLQPKKKIILNILIFILHLLVYTTHTQHYNISHNLFELALRYLNTIERC